MEFYLAKTHAISIVANMAIVLTDTVSVIRIMLETIAIDYRVERSAVIIRRVKCRREFVTVISDIRIPAKTAAILIKPNVLYNVIWRVLPWLKASKSSSSTENTGVPKICESVFLSA